jgi:hypothetical protein
LGGGAVQHTRRSGRSPQPLTRCRRSLSETTAENVFGFRCQTAVHLSSPGLSGQSSTPRPFGSSTPSLELVWGLVKTDGCVRVVLRRSAVRSRNQRTSRLSFWKIKKAILSPHLEQAELGFSNSHATVLRDKLARRAIRAWRARIRTHACLFGTRLLPHEAVEIGARRRYHRDLPRPEPGLTRAFSRSSKTAGTLLRRWPRSGSDRDLSPTLYVGGVGW